MPGKIPPKTESRSACIFPWVWKFPAPMSQPASDPDEPDQATPAGAPPPPPVQEFDLLAFWIQHRKLIIRLVVLAFLGVAIWGGYEFMQYRKRVGSEEALAKAESPEDFRKVIAEWGGTPAAAIAHLRLAEELRQQNKPEEAAKAIGYFLQDYPLHPLRTAGFYAQAASLETAGKLDEALAAYKQMASSHGTSAFAPIAFIGQARVLTAQGKLDDARRALETVQQQFPTSPFLDEANVWLDQIKNPAGWKTGGTPRPTPPTPPTPPKTGIRPTPPTPPVPLTGTPPKGVPQPVPPAPAPPANAPPSSPVPQPVPIPAPGPTGGTVPWPGSPPIPAPAAPPTAPVPTAPPTPPATTPPGA